MSLIKSFKMGGIHPKDRKEFTNTKSIVNANYPKSVRIPLTQCAGKPAKCVVKVGDIVREGDLIGERDGNFSSNIHSSIRGKVSKIDKGFIASGLIGEYVQIDFEGKFEKQEIKTNDYKNLSRKDILEKIIKAGIVGLGGAGFPTHIKYSPPPEKPIDTLIINGVECEPYITADHRLMLEKTEEIIKGINILKKLLAVKNIYIGIENNKRDAIEKLTIFAKDKDKDINIVPLKVKYPQGGEKQLIKAILNKEVPSGGLPMDLGVIVSNIGTTFAVYEAITIDKPLIERIVTISGKILKSPGNFKVRIGTSIKDLIEECGLKEEPRKIIVGGPMTGITLFTDDLPVTKWVSGILVLSKKEAKEFNDYSCIRCGRCIKVCPTGLMPCFLAEYVNANQLDIAKQNGLMDCILCGCCSYVCPAERKLAGYFKHGKLIVKTDVKYANHRIPVIPV